MNPSVILTAHLPSITSMIYLLSAHRVILQLRSTSWTHRLSWETMLHNSINCSSLTGTTDLCHCDHSPLVELVNVTHFFRPKGFVFNCDIKKICNLSLSRSNKRRQHRAHTPPHCHRTDLWIPLWPNHRVSDRLNGVLCVISATEVTVGGLTHSRNGQHTFDHSFTVAALKSADAYFPLPVAGEIHHLRRKTIG